MIDGKTILGIVVARGGSKGLPRKNVLDCAGKPLIAWTVQAGLQSAVLDRLILSTDDAEIIAAAQAAGCEIPFVRPARLAGDESSVYDVLIHALDNCGRDYDYLVLLQATSPLRKAADIDAVVELCVRSGAPAAVSMTKAPKPPYWCQTVDADGRMRPVVEPPGLDGRGQRQSLPQTYVPNGAVYVAETLAFRAEPAFFGPECRAYVMPAERSVDVDYPMDLALADLLLRQDAP